MKQKYTITVADIELSIISDASPDEVENLVGMLDRRMRDFNLKSPRCTKNEAAILCALSYCSERIAMQEAFKKVEKDSFRYASENEKLKKTIEGMQEELDTLRKDASVMRSILDRAAIAAIPQPAPEATAVESTVKKEDNTPQQLSAFDVPVAPMAPVAPVASTAPVAPVAPVDATPAEDTVSPAEETAPSTPTEKPKKNGKGTPQSRMGTMFDLLTFSDV